MSTYAVSIVMTKTNNNGSFNIVNRLFIFDEVDNEDKLKGRAISLAMESHKEHQVFSVLIQEVYNGKETTEGNE